MSSISSIQYNKAMEVISKDQLPQEYQMQEKKIQYNNEQSDNIFFKKQSPTLQRQDNIQLPGQQNSQEQQQKKRMQSLSNLFAMFQKKSQQDNLQQIHENQQQSSKTLSSKQSSEQSQQRFKKRSKAQISISQPIEQRNQHSINHGSNSRTKSKFAKQNHFVESSQQPIIITSSHKTFLTPSKNNINVHVNNVNSPSSKLLVPNSNSNNFGSNRQLTSAGNLLVTQEPNTLISSKSITSLNKSSQQIGGKTATFAPLPSQQVQQQSAGISLYQQVLAKNFEVIDNLLRKLNQIYSHQEEYQTTITQISQKLHKLQIDNENIHHEFRTSHFMIDKKLNSITNQYSNIVQDMNIMKKMWTENGGPGLSYFVNSFTNADDDGDGSSRKRKHSGPRRVKNRKSSQIRRDSITRLSILNPNGVNNNLLNHGNINGSNESQRSSSRNNSINSKRRSTKKSMLMDRKSSNWTNLKGLDQQNLGKILLQKINQSSSQESSSSEGERNSFSSQQLQDGQSVGKFRNNQGQEEQFSQSIIEHKDSNYNRKFSKNRAIKQSALSRHALKSKNKKPRISIDSFDLEEISQLKNYISQQFIKMSDSNQMKKFASLGIQATITKKCEMLEEKMQEKIFQVRRQILQQKLQKQFRNSILQQINEQTTKMIEENLQKARMQLDQKISTIETKINKQIDRKVDKQEVRQDLKQILESMNRKVNNLMDQCYHKFAERVETKRAILFLEKKINKIIQTQKRFNLQASIQTNENVKCLSCNKNVPYTVTPGHSHQNQQVMFTQVHLAPGNQGDQPGIYAKESNVTTARKQANSSKNDKQYSVHVSQSKMKVKFIDITNLNNTSVNQVYNNSGCGLNSEEQSNVNRQSSTTVKNQNQNAKSSKQIFMNKIKNAPSQSLHFTASHTKLSSATQQSRPTTSNFSINDVSQKNWKEKAVTILKKEAMTSTGINWRSKSSYKKVA